MHANLVDDKKSRKWHGEFFSILPIKATVQTVLGMYNLTDDSDWHWIAYTNC